MFYASVLPPRSIKVKITNTIRKVSSKVSILDDASFLDEEEFFTTFAPVGSDLKVQIKEKLSDKVNSLLERALNIIKEAEETNSPKLYNQAGKYLDKAIFLDPDNECLYRPRGHCFVQIEDFLSAIKYYTVAHRLHPGEKTRLNAAKLSYGHSLCNAGKYKEARTLAEYCLESNADTLLFLIEIDGLEGSKADYDSKIKSFVDKYGETKELLAILTKKFKDSSCMFQSDIYLRLAQQHGGKSGIESIGEENYKLCNRLLMMNRPLYALNHINTAIKLIPENPNFHIARGRINERVGCLVDACRDFLEAYRLTLLTGQDEEGPTGHINRLLNRLAVRCIGQGLLDEALQLLNSVIQSSRYYQFYVNRAQCLQKMGEFEMAVEDYNEAIDCGGANLHERLAYCYYEFGLRESDSQRAVEAEELFSKAIELEERQEFFFARSKNRIEQKKFDMAVDDMCKVVRLMEYPDEYIDQIKVALLRKFNKNNNFKNVCNRLIHHHK